MKNILNKIKEHFVKRENIYKILLIVLLAIDLLFLFYVFYVLPVIPMKYLIVIVLVLLLVSGVLVYSQFGKKVNIHNKRLGKVGLILMSFILLFVNIYMYFTKDILSGVTGSKYKIDTVSIIVLKDSPYKTIEDVLDKTIGEYKDEDQLVVRALADIQIEHLVELNIKDEYESNSELVKALYSSEVEAIIINEAFRSIIVEEFENFNDETRIIHSIKTESLIDNSKKVPVTTQPFTIYISGADYYGEIVQASRSDVNLLVTVNPITKVILITTTPRDSYLPLACISGKPRDKFTHSGIYGVDCSISTLEEAFETDINYYARINFSGMEKIVDALGGVEVESTHAFVTNDEIQIYEGLNTMDGKTALSFARDRDHQGSGDIDRGKNQMKVLTAMLKKAMSPAIITNYMNILNSVKSDFLTTLTSDDIVALASMQLNDMAKWTIITNSVTGTTGFNFSYAMGQNLAMFFPNTQSLQYATELIDQVIAGTLLEQPEPVDFGYEAPPEQVRPDPEPEPEPEVPTTPITPEQPVEPEEPENPEPETPEQPEEPGGENNIPPESNGE